MKTKVPIILLFVLFTSSSKDNPIINQYDLLTNWLDDFSISPVYNSCINSEGKTKEHSVEGKKNFYPEITPAFEGIQRLEFGDLNLKLDNCNMNYSFFTSGEQTYEIGSLSGAFLRRGVLWGDETGVWSQPFKMLDGILVEISINGQKFIPLNECKVFTNRLYSVNFEYDIDGIYINRTDFAPNNHPAFCYRLNIKNTNNLDKKIRLKVSLQTNIRPIWQKNWFVEYGEDEVLKHENGIYTVKDKYISDVEVGIGYHGKLEYESETDTRNKYRNRIVYNFDFNLNSQDEEMLDFTALMYDQKKIRQVNAQQQYPSTLVYLKDIITTTDFLLKNKEQLYNSKISEGVIFSCPDSILQKAFYLGKYNLQALSSDTRPYLKYPHIMTSPERAYQLLFGIDPLYTAMGAMCTGFESIVKATLDNHLHYAMEINNKGINYLVDHWGRHDDSGGRAQETTQFIGTVWEFLKISGDKKYAKQIYPQMRELMSNVMKLDIDGDGWLEGMTFPRISRETKAEKELSAAVRLIWALEAMSEYATLMKDKEESLSYQNHAHNLKVRFNKEWWREDIGTWAIGLYRNKMNENIFIDEIIYNQGSINYPQKYKIADIDKGKKSICSVWKNAVDEQFGYRGPAITTWQSCNYALGCYHYNEPDKAYKLLHRAAKNPTVLQKMLGTFSTINSNPEKPAANSNKIIYNWSVGPFLETILYGLLGITPNAFNCEIQFNPQIPPDWEYCEILNYKMGNFLIDFKYDKDDTSWYITNNGQDQLILTTPFQTSEITIKPGRIHKIKV